MDPSDQELFFKKPFKNGIFGVLPKKILKLKNPFLTMAVKET